MRDIWIRNIRMDNIKEQAVIMNMGYSSAIGSERDVEKRYPEEDIPEFCHIHMSDILCIGAKKAVDICGLAQRPIHDILWNALPSTHSRAFSAATPRTFDSRT